MHSVSWNWGLFVPKLNLNSNNKIEICCREFKNESETFNDFYTKLQYLITWTVQENVFDEYDNTFQSLVHSLKSVNLNFDGFELDFERSESGYIESQSIWLAGAILRSPVILYLIFYSTLLFL